MNLTDLYNIPYISKNIPLVYVTLQPNNDSMLFLQSQVSLGGCIVPEVVKCFYFQQLFIHHKCSLKVN